MKSWITLEIAHLSIDQIWLHLTCLMWWDQVVWLQVCDKKPILEIADLRKAKQENVQPWTIQMEILQ